MKRILFIALLGIQATAQFYPHGEPGLKKFIVVCFNDPPRVVYAQDRLDAAVRVMIVYTSEEWVQIQKEKKTR